jgi:hypothetical protein
MRQMAMGMALLASVIWSVGCSSDDDGGTTTGTTSTTTDGTTTDGATTGGDTATTDGGATTDGTGATTGGGTGTDGTACLNADDGAIVQSDLDVTGEATTCGLGCIGKADTCAGECVAEKTGLSGGCAGCYAEIINCTIANCVGACATDPGSDDCGTCQAENGCVQLFYDCSGLTEDAGDDGGTVDGGTVDGGTVDGGTTDGGMTDGGMTDGGMTDGGTTGDAATTWTADIQPLFDAKCTGCHTGSNLGGHNLGSEYTAALDAANAGACADLNKAECTIVRIQNGSMPQGAGCSGDAATDAGNDQCFTQAEQDLIQAWIDGGSVE